MTDARADLKAELMTEAETLTLAPRAGRVRVDELVEWTADTPTPTLTQIEDIVLKLRQPLSERMALAVIEAQAAVRPVPGPSCPTCGRETRSDYKDRKANTVESRVGCLPLERGYYYCETCRSGLFPPGSTASTSSVWRRPRRGRVGCTTWPSGRPPSRSTMPGSGA